MKTSVLFIAAVLLIISLGLCATGVQLYIFNGKEEISEKDIPNLGKGNYDVTKKQLPESWKSCNIKSGDTVTLKIGSIYVIEWFGIKKVYATMIDYRNCSGFSHDTGLEDFEIGRYADGDKRGLLITPIEKGDSVRGIFLIDKEASQTVGGIYFNITDPKPKKKTNSKI